MIKPSIAIIISTYNRVDDARINMEIIRSLWDSSGLFKNTILIHAFNGSKKWWPDKYLEDETIRLKNRGHFRGAVDLILPPQFPERKLVGWSPFRQFLSHLTP